MENKPADPKAQQNVDPNAEEEEETGQPIDFLHGVPMEVSVVLDTTMIKVNELLEFKTGTVVHLNKFAGDSLDFYVNKKRYGNGEVVVVNERFGLRITDLAQATQETS